MGARRKAREAALQMLYQMDAQGQPIPSDLSEFWAMGSHPPEVTGYAERLVRRTWENRASIDEAIKRSSQHWSLHRMDRVARSLLRLATCELLYMEDVPPKVAINEAVEIA
ncbi:MAG: transcription antitermination factor NusB, partial [Nitrospinota bacterium]